MPKISTRKSFDTVSPPRRVQIVVGSGARYFKPGQYAYVIGYDKRGGYYWVDKDGESAPGEVAYLVSKSKNMAGGALWFSGDGLRFTTRRDGRSKSCVKCGRLIRRPVLAAGEAERCASCADY